MEVLRIWDKSFTMVRYGLFRLVHLVWGCFASILRSTKRRLSLISFGLVRLLMRRDRVMRLDLTSVEITQISELLVCVFGFMPVLAMEHNTLHWHPPKVVVGSPRTGCILVVLHCGTAGWAHLIIHLRSHSSAYQFQLPLSNQHRQVGSRL